MKRATLLFRVALNVVIGFLGVWLALVAEDSEVLVQAGLIALFVLLFGNNVVLLLQSRDD